jgi:2-hydroxy-3-keto-5-methylthiopentenyl-1-phosphate phosphatase
VTSLTRRPMLFFDFDNTVTLGDVLDAVIERFSINEDWRQWEQAWQKGELSTLECLRRQIGNLRASQADLLAFVAGTAQMDPAFGSIVEWSTTHRVELSIVSDSFSVLVHEILRQNALFGIPVFANELVFSGDRLEAVFPYRDPACPRCAHCKAQHLRRHADRVRIFVGDGLSDLCPALEADVVFAKGSLAAHLAQRNSPFLEFDSLLPVLQYLEAEHFPHAGTPSGTRTLRSRGSGSPSGTLDTPEAAKSPG